MDAFGIDTPNAEEAGSQAQTLASGRASLPEALSGLVRLLRSMHKHDFAAPWKNKIWFSG